MRRFFRSERGSVSVYLIVVMTALFVFHAVLIDFIRIEIAEIESEKALKASLRSSLSAFDSGLREYGLFGVQLSSDQVRGMMEEVMRKNLSVEKQGSGAAGLRWLEIALKPGSPVLQTTYSLADQRVFKQQILEDMKYRAPIQFTLHVTDAFKKPASAIQSAARFAQGGEELDRLMKQRERALEAAWSETKSMVDHLQGRRGFYQTRLGSLKSPAEEAGQEFQRQLAEVVQHAANDMLSLQQSQARLSDRLDEAESANDKLKEALQKVKADSGDAEIDPDLFNYVNILDRTYFENYLSGAAETLSGFGAFFNQLRGISLHEGGYENAYEANERYALKASSWLAVRKQDMDRRREGADRLERAKREKQDETKTQLEKAGQELKKNSCSSADQAEYQKLGGDQGLYRTYLDVNRIAFANETDPSLAMNAPDHFGRASLAFLDQLIGRMTDLRDEVYVNEYMLSRFNNRMTETEWKGKEGVPPAGLHPLKGQETEYILYGLSSCAANQAAAYAEVFMIRLAIRTVEALAQPEADVASFGSPLLAFLVALAEGSVKAYGDMDHLLKGEKLEISSKLKSVKLGYSDYLRIFLLLHSNEQHKLARAQSLIHLNTNADLGDRAVYLQASAALSLRLWFLPGAIGMLHAVNLLDGKVKGDRYEMDCVAALSY